MLSLLKRINKQGSYNILIFNLNDTAWRRAFLSYKCVIQSITPSRLIISSYYFNPWSAEQCGWVSGGWVGLDGEEQTQTLARQRGLGGHLNPETFHPWFLSRLTLPQFNQLWHLGILLDWWWQTFWAFYQKFRKWLTWLCWHVIPNQHSTI